MRKVDVDQSWRLWRPGGGQAERTGDVRPGADEQVLPVTDDPAVKSVDVIESKYGITIPQLKEGTYALRVSDTCERDLQVPRGRPGGGFRPRRAGEQGCSLPPPAPLASLSLLRVGNHLCGSSQRHARVSRQSQQQHQESGEFDNTYR